MFRGGFETATRSNHNTVRVPPRSGLRLVRFHWMECFGIIRKNWNDTEKISMAPAQG